MRKILTGFVVLCLAGACALYPRPSQSQNFPLHQRISLPFDQSIQEIAMAKTWIAVATNSRLAAVDPATQKILWTADGPVIGDGEDMLALDDNLAAATADNVFLFNRDGQQEKIDLAPGGEEILSLVSLYPNSIYVLQSHEWTLEAYDLSTNSLRWQYRVGRGGASNAYLDEARNILYVSGHSIMALDNETGTLLWTIPTDTETSVLDQDVIYEYDALGGDSYRVAAYRVYDQKQIWSKNYEFAPAQGINELRVMGNTLILCGTNLTALDKSSGRELWQVAVGETFYKCPIEYQGTLYAKSGVSRTVYAIDPTTGAVLGQASQGVPSLILDADAVSGVVVWENGIALSTPNQLVIYPGP